MNDTLIYSPVGWANPYYSYSYTTFEKLDFATITPYYYLPSYRTYRQYAGTETKGQSNTINQYEQDIITLPDNSIFYYNLSNYVDDVFQEQNLAMFYYTYPIEED